MTDIAYGTFMKGIINALQTTLLGASSFSSGQAYFGWVENPSDVLNVRINLVEDNIENTGVNVHIHYIVYELQLRWIGGREETDVETFMDYVGELVDEIEDTPKLGLSYIQDTTVDRTSWSRTPDAQGLLHTGVIYITVRGMRN